MMKNLKSAIVTIAVILPVPLSGQDKPDGTCMDVFWYEGSRGDRSGWAYKYNADKLETEACRALSVKAAEDFSINHPPRPTPKKFEAALTALKDLNEKWTATQSAHREVTEEATRLSRSHSELSRLFADRDFSPYRRQLSAYQAEIDSFPARVERYENAQSEAIVAYDTLRDRFRNDPYPYEYDWSRGGDQGLWKYDPLP